jgi:hypothetical protein
MKIRSFMGVLVVSLLFSLHPYPSSAQTSDLTGTWQDDVGGRYLIRQTGNTIAWLDDQRPAAQNVFMGTIEGSTISGRWIDLPGAQILNSGNLTLRIESKDRLVKISSSVLYGGSVITRAGSGGGDIYGNAGCDLSGTWQEDLEGQGQSTWSFTSLGGGRYRGQEQGLGNATAELTVSGRGLRMDWKANGGYAGYSELTLDSACNTATGTVFYSSGRSGTSKIQLKRSGRGSDILPVSTCDMAGTWLEELAEQGQSTWTFTSLGSGRFRGREQGLGNATAELTVSGRGLRMDWKADGGYAGYSELTLNTACNSAEGTVFYTSGRSGTSKIVLKRR